MKQFVSLILAFLSAFVMTTLVACQKEPSPSASIGTQPSLDPIPVAEVLLATENTLAISINEVAEGTTLLSVMQALKNLGAIDYQTDPTNMILSVNGKTPASGSYWLLYTSDQEMANTQWGSIVFEDKTFGSAVLGAETLPVVSGAIYVWQITAF